MKIRFTVFTPTYNRAYIIEKLYRSLQAQTFRSFEWVIVDDGSTDNTKELIDKWRQEDNSFTIKYEKVNNGGKCKAINKGVQTASGELFFIVDSDDYLPHDSLEILDRWEKTIPDDEKSSFCGICGQRATFDGKALGTTFDGAEFLDATHIERDIVYHLDGDKAEVYYTDVVKKFPFPEIDGENFLLESVVWERMAYAGYKIRYFQDIVYYCEYIEDGLTKFGVKKFMDNPKGYALSVNQRIDFGIYSKGKVWQERLKYYSLLKGNLGIKEIANNLKIPAISLIWHILFRKIRAKLKIK